MISILCKLMFGPRLARNGNTTAVHAGAIGVVRTLFLRGSALYAGHGGESVQNGHLMREAAEKGMF